MEEPIGRSTVIRLPRDLGVTESGNFPTHGSQRMVVLKHLTQGFVK